MGLQGFERSVERMVEGVFSRAFRSSIKPIELGRRMLREMDDHRSLDVKGRTIVPNAFTFVLSPEDHRLFSEIHEPLVSELGDAAREHARDEQYHFMGPITIALESDGNLKAGRFLMTSQMQATASGTGAGSLRLPSGERHVLTAPVTTIGRMADCELPVGDPNISRRHAEVRAQGSGFVLHDLGSTNGTRVNGVVVAEHVLRDGDVITLGGTRLTFEAS